ncbi:MAG TPA: hypothetical protein VNQ80_08215 [Parapedobacter sp.]|uniref:hypothetical protein n=1 Tax=Parapedobacter sp. TaxID=1958893 RepID=UPI002B8D0E1E|nr:hypothetical protein [Parapedobacter sp.]HWK57306.1 hypothetical protein [Parapedobacter sp.]
MPDYKSNIVTVFRRYVDEILKGRYKNKHKREPIRDEIQDIIASQGGELFGNVFYTILKKLEVDIADACSVLFSDLEPTPLKDLDGDESKLAKFLVPYTRTDSEVSDASLIDGARFSRVKNKLLPDLYAFEVYGLAKAFGLNPSQLFDYFYGDGPRPVTGL